MIPEIEVLLQNVLRNMIIPPITATESHPDNLRMVRGIIGMVRGIKGRPNLVMEIGDVTHQMIDQGIHLQHLGGDRYPKIDVEDQVIVIDLAMGIQDQDLAGGDYMIPMSLEIRREMEEGEVGHKIVSQNLMERGVDVIMAIADAGVLLCQKWICTVEIAGVIGSRSFSSLSGLLVDSIGKVKRRLTDC
jgi:hypothetical protein